MRRGSDEEETWMHNHAIRLIKSITHHTLSCTHLHMVQFVALLPVPSLHGPPRCSPCAQWPNFISRHGVMYAFFQRAVGLRRRLFHR
ncbi:hypothetical protein EYC84_010091 [Monilinia fructicola]|uniref:Uncharacterized protein n=1 Tax=Monilinia fructicola TaxID=38448 RepID=A0A5M9JCC5_MONFR|nr:hypothetical protein EYC84_010091 [Monilinia fructicola]